jgi:hypothetical protein
MNNQKSLLVLAMAGALSANFSFAPALPSAAFANIRFNSGRSGRDRTPGKPGQPGAKLAKLAKNKRCGLRA